MKQIIITLAIVFVFYCCGKHNNKNEYNYETFRMDAALSVLNENQIAKTYFFKYDTVDYYLEYEYTFLGEIKNAKEGNLKFLFCTTFFGIYEDSQKASSTILIFKKNKLYGLYCFYIEYPTPVINGSDLIFSIGEPECNFTTAINFKYCIPQEIFIKCMIESGTIFGEIFSFEKW